MRLFGRFLEAGREPETVFDMERFDRLIYRAVLELNEEQKKRNLTECIYNAIAEFWNDVHQK